MYSFYACGAYKCKKDSQVVSLFMLLVSAHAKAARKYVGEIDSWWCELVKYVLDASDPLSGKMSQPRGKYSGQLKRDWKIAKFSKQY